MTDRTVFTITGPDRHSFLAGLITNSFDAQSPLTYAALLTAQGKFVADFFLLNDAEQVLLDVASTHASLLFTRLNMYKLRADVAIAQSDLSVSLGSGHADPRHPELPHRAYSTTSDSSASSAITSDALSALSVRLAVPQTGIELTPDTYILEAGFERLNGIDFKKGCFVGQEICARMKHKTELKKGLVKVAHDGSAKADTPITKDGKPAGHLYSVSGNLGLAHIRFDRADGMRADETALTVID
ncbi:YgfZ/GcvT domain-containing protein [Nereida sp. NH-UV-3]|uniref:CAF17-like 4Fe-4S cluster assembly/insertion protein YgfZ n=1 Tax=Nereida TaxID=282198 RepID=UPI0036F25126